MNAVRITWVGAIAAFATLISGQAFAQATGQYYGYGSAQAPVASGQGQYGCQPEKWGCQVEVCPPPCQNVNIPVPGFEMPSCQNAFTIVSEEAPHLPPATIVVYRNHYVPIRVVPKPTPVQPVNIVVKWREIHYLCDCPPGTTQCPHIPAGASLQSKAEGATPNPPVAVASTEPTPAVSSTPSVPTVPAVAHDNTPPKRWIWLQKQGLYGFGYQRPDGLWVIDAGSKRPDLPAEEMSQSDQFVDPNTTVAVTTGL